MIPKRTTKFTSQLSHCNSDDCPDQPLTVIPLNILGVICYRLSQNGWQELANTINLDTNRFDQMPSDASDLLSAAMEAQATVESHLNTHNLDNMNTVTTNNNNCNNLSNPINDLTITVSLIQHICKHNMLNLGQLLNCLQKLNRPDLIALIQQTTIKCKKSIGHSSNEEYKNKRNQ
ncbi:unnamed protein product [Heterobilharzia americana]|nr:unnamed protein product [Heterobilharzia americana]